MNTRLFSAISAAAFLALGASAAHASADSCIASAHPSGSRSSGVRASMSDILPISRSVALTRIKKGLQREGYDLSAGSDEGSVLGTAKIHTHRFKNILVQSLDNQETTQTVYVETQPVGHGTKVTLTVSYESGFSVKVDPADYCQFIASLGD